MKQTCTLTDFEISFFTDENNNEQAGLLLDGDYFNVTEQIEDIAYQVSNGSLIIESTTKKMIILGLSETLFSEILRKDVFFLMLVDYDLLVECTRVI